MEVASNAKIIPSAPARIRPRLYGVMQSMRRPSSTRMLGESGTRMMNSPLILQTIMSPTAVATTS